MKLPILPLSQKDPRWGLKRLGGTSVTISNYGCLLTCHSMMLKYFGHADMLPDVLNELYKSKGVFDPEGQINFWAAADCFDDITAEEYYACLNDPCDLSKIDRHLEKKMPVIAMVDFSPSEGIQTHFVLIIGKENNSYLVNDPWTGETYFFEAKYGDPSRYIFGLRIYSGREVPNGTACEDQLSDCKTTLKSCEEALAGKSLEVNNLRTSLETQERDNQDLANQLLTARGERDTATQQAKDANAKVTGLEESLEEAKKAIDVLKDEKKALAGRLEVCQVQELSSYPRLTLLLAVFARRGGAK